METTETIVADFRYVVTVMENNSVEIGKFYLTPNTNDVAFFDLSQVLEARLESDVVDNSGGALWDASTVLTKSPKSNRGFQVRLAYFTGGVESATTDTSDIHLLNGYLQQRLGLNPGFTDYYATGTTAKSWLTDKPPSADGIIHYKMRAEDSGAFAFIFNRLVSTNLYYIIRKVYTASGLSQTVLDLVNTSNGAKDPAITPMGDGNLVCFANCGPQNISAGSVPPTSSWTYMDFTLAQDSVNLISRKLRITRDCSSPKTEPTQMSFSNSVGGYDYIRWDGRRKQTLTNQDKTYRTLQGTWGAATFSVDATGSDTKVFQKEVTESYSLNSLMSAEDFTLLSSAFKSRDVFVKIDGYWLPCKIKEGSMTMQTEAMSKLTSVTVNVEILQAVRC